MSKIEQIGQWPEAQLKARAVFRCKDITDAGNLMSYIILKITSALYRLWASVRMRHLEGWVEQWADKAMYAGVAGVGADDVWYRTAIDMELMRTASTHISAGSIDMYKCFDQIVRDLIVALAKEAGMPRCILAAYSHVIHNLGIRMQVRSTLAKEHTDKCSIPRGCHFSMSMVSLLINPWISIIRQIGVEPRTLADDLFVHAGKKDMQQSSSRRCKLQEHSLQILQPR
jgi:hypothetical protein